MSQKKAYDLKRAQLFLLSNRLKTIMVHFKDPKKNGLLSLKGFRNDP